MKKFNSLITIAILIVLVATILTLNVVVAGNLNSNIIDVSVSVEQTKLVQQQLANFGYYDGKIDGFYNDTTKEAITEFQKDKGINATGIVDSHTAIALELQAVAQTAEDIYLLAKVIHAEARGEPYIGQVAVGAVVLNRVKSDKFPDTIREVIYQPFAFTAVDDGQINLEPNEAAYKAAEDAFSGWDPSYGSLFYYNPVTATSAWIFTRETVTEIGKHVFAI
jgi:N-acetylmuramoyl-L-alanine amidase